MIKFDEEKVLLLHQLVIESTGGSYEIRDSKRYYYVCFYTFKPREDKFGSAIMSCLCPTVFAYLQAKIGDFLIRFCCQKAIFAPKMQKRFVLFELYVIIKFNVRFSE